MKFDIEKIITFVYKAYNKLKNVKTLKEGLEKVQDLVYPFSHHIGALLYEEQCDVKMSLETIENEKYIIFSQLKKIPVEVFVKDENDNDIFLPEIQDFKKEIVFHIEELPIFICPINKIEMLKVIKQNRLKKESILELNEKEPILNLN